MTNNEEMRNVSISEGTLHGFDLLVAFSETLRKLSPDAWTQLYVAVGHAPVPAYALEDRDSEWWDSEDAEALLWSLSEELDTLAPDGYTFGAHPDDGALFGFWSLD